MPIVRRKLGITAPALAAAAAVAAAAVAAALAWWPPRLRAPEPISAPAPASGTTSQATSPSAAEESGSQVTEGRTLPPAAPPIAARDRSRHDPSRRPAPRPYTPPRVSSPEAPQPPHPISPQPMPVEAPGAGRAPATPPAGPADEGSFTTPPGAQLTAPPPLVPEVVPPVNRAHEPVITAPVPVALTAPRHPIPYQMIVEAPGIASGARLKGVEARVRLRLLVRADGTVGRTEIAVPSGRPELDAAAHEAAGRWRFLPARRDGDPIESIVLIWVTFTSGP